MSSSSYFHILAYRASIEEAIEDLDHGRAAAVVVIPPEFSRNLTADRAAEIQVILDGSDPNFAGIVRSYVTSIAEQNNAKLLLNFLNRQGMEKIRPPVDGRIRIWFNEDLESRNFIIPGIIAIIIMIVGALLTSLIIAREYENGTMETIKRCRSMPWNFTWERPFPIFALRSPTFWWP